MKFTHPVYIHSAKRTAIGRFGGSLKDISAAKLAQIAGAAVLSDGTMVEEVVAGQVLQAGTGINMARQTLLRLGIPQEITAYTVNMVCGSGMKATGAAAEHIASGEISAALALGVESMSQAPYYADANRWGSKYGNSTLRDSIVCDGLTDPIANVAMGVTAENLAKKYQLSRADQDAWALRSQQLVAGAKTDFEREIVPVELKKGTFSVDEHGRADTTAEKLAALKPAFDPAGTVTAGNSSGINDGAAALYLTNAKGRARIAGYATAGCDPLLMGIGPVIAIQKLCKDIGWNLSEIPAIEINEAFAAQTLAGVRELKLDENRVNQRGGAIALGHPIGCSGARVLVTLLHLMEDKGYSRGIASLCIGGGMGIAMALEI